jgi:hypothetical protein
MNKWSHLMPYDFPVPPAEPPIDALYQCRIDGNTWGLYDPAPCFHTEQEWSDYMTANSLPAETFRRILIDPTALTPLPMPPVPPDHGAPSARDYKVQAGTPVQLKLEPPK